MATLTSIPRELRDQILADVIQSHQNTRPALDQTFEQLIQNREILKTPTLQSWCTTVLNTPESVTPNATGLLLVNHQLRTETLETIERLNARIIDLDVIILDEILPLPTWLHVPTSSTTLDKMTATLRISGCYDERKDKPYKSSDYDPSICVYAKYGYYKGFRGGCGAGPAMDWQTYSILERFIKAGPVGQVDEEHTHRHMSIKSLVINVETPPDVDETRLGEPRSMNYADPDDGELTRLDPTYLVSAINLKMDWLLRGGSFEWFSYGQILYEHVDTIKIQRDGKEVDVFDVAQRLRDVGGFEEITRDWQQEAWNKICPLGLEEWKRVTWEEREKRGLKVFGDVGIDEKGMI
jgi:hypothetical protein